MDLMSKGIKGSDAESALAAANITSNKNPVPFDAARPDGWVGLRLGVAAATTRGLREAELAALGRCIGELIEAQCNGGLNAAANRAKQVVAELCARFPAYAD